ncbi:MAG TPA: hypothetical protein VEC11_12505 [Allosphingosinicella sp.]|nr:hypothetical protein [Allosphingosinicella sp.]
MARDYGPVLERAEDLQAFSGYLDAEDLKRQGKVRVAFQTAVRNLVYALYRESPDHGALGFSVSGDLDRIARAGEFSPGAVAEAREALLREIQARSRNSGMMRFLVRWGPPVLGLLGIAVYAFFKWLALG